MKKKAKGRPPSPVCRGAAHGSIERILTTTNHVVEDLSSITTKKQLVDAVKYWNLQHFYEHAELVSLRTRVLVFAMEIQKPNDQAHI